MGWQENMTSTGNIFGIDVSNNMANTGNIFGIQVPGWGQSSSSTAADSTSTTTSSSTPAATSSGSSSSSGTGASAAPTTYAMDGKTQGYYDDAHGYLDRAWGTLDEAKGYVSGLTGVANQTLDAWNQYKAEYDPVKKAALSLAGQEYGAKSGYLSKLQNIDNMTYDAEAGRAGATVAQQAEIARQEQARALARQGVNAASGKSQALTQQGFLQEALAKAGAMTSARDTARDKNFNESMTAYSTIDPSKSVGSALAISSGANQLLGQYNDVMTQQAGLANQNASTAGGLANTGVNLASSYGNTQLGYSKLNQQAASDAAQIGLGYYKANNDYRIADRNTTLSERQYRDSRTDKITNDAMATHERLKAQSAAALSNTAGRSASGAASAAANSLSSSAIAKGATDVKNGGGTWKPLGAGLYNTATGAFKSTRESDIPGSGVIDRTF